MDATGAFNKYTKSVKAEYGNPMPEIGILPEKSGVVFEGYYSEPDGAGTKYYTGLGGSVRAWDQNVSTATLYAHWVDPCLKAPTLKPTIPVITIWDGQEVDLGIVRLTCDFDTTGITYSLVSASENIPGCSFDYFDEQIHLSGTPALGNTSMETKSITFTITNNCSSSPSYTVTSTIRIYPVGQKPKVAFIVTGTQGGGFDAINTDDRDACSGLLSYLSAFYDITCVNGYNTKNVDIIRAYYAQYDLLVVTDFPMNGHRFLNLRNLYGETAPSGYWEVLYDGRAKVLKQVVRILMQDLEGNLRSAMGYDGEYRAGVYNVFVYEEKFCYMAEDGTLTPIRRRSQLMRFYKDHKREINRHMSHLETSGMLPLDRYCVEVIKYAEKL